MGSQMTSEESGPSERTTVKRGANRAVYGLDQIKEILDAGIIAHVGVGTPEGPIVLPMAYGVRDDEILVHGAVANSMLRNGRSAEVCITVTIVDGLVVARSPFHNSMNYRSVVVRGEATVVGPEEKVEALRVINDHIAPIWDIARYPNHTDLKRTLVLTVPLTEASAKVRAGDPIDDEDDLTGPHWSGVLPLQSTWGEPTSAADLIAGISIPDVVSDLANTDAHPQPE